MDKEYEGKWDELYRQMTAGGDVDLGQCRVTAELVDGVVALSISNMYGMGFQLMMPSDLADSAKEALIALVECNGMDGTYSEESFKSALLDGFENTLLPAITEELRDEVKDIPPLRALLAIMSYLELISDAISKEGVGSVTLGPDGDLYFGVEMPLSPKDITDHIRRLSELGDDDITIMKKWIPSVARVFEGIFPGYICEADGVAVKVTLVNIDLADSFSDTVEEYWGDGIDIELESMTDDDDMLSLLLRNSAEDMADAQSYEEVKNSYTSRKVISKAPVEYVMGLMHLNGFPEDEVSLIRTTLLNIYSHAGEIVQFDDMIPSGDEEDVQMVMDNICFAIEENRDDEKLMLTWGSEGIMFMKGDGKDEEGEG